MLSAVCAEVFATDDALEGGEDDGVIVEEFNATVGGVGVFPDMDFCSYAF